MQGTWKTDSGGAGDVLRAIVVVAVVLAGVSAAARAVAAVPLYVWIAAAAAGAAVIAASVALAVRLWRRETARAPDWTARQVTPRRAQPLSARRPAGLPPAQYHEHIHFHGVSADDVAAILAARNRTRENK
jgi:protein-S-isoprenylcysteine O-methyltransferase Ste14